MHVTAASPKLNNKPQQVDTELSNSKSMLTFGDMGIIIHDISLLTLAILEFLND